MLSDIQFCYFFNYQTDISNQCRWIASLIVKYIHLTSVLLYFVYAHCIPSPFFLQ